MTAPVHLVEPGALTAVVAGSAVVLDGPEGRHAVTVRRTRVGERVDVADGAGRIARCVVEVVGRDRLELRVLSADDLAAPRPRLVLVQALAKGGRDELAVETATELGVDGVVPWQADRSVAVWAGDRRERGRARWRAAAREAAKQARRATVPDVEPPVDTGGLVDRLAAADVALVLHEDAGRSLADLDLGAVGNAAELLVVVGPEGGIDVRELERLTGAGAVAARLGPHVLRTSSAGPAALAVLAVRLGRWS